MCYLREKGNFLDMSACVYNGVAKYVLRASFNVTSLLEALKILSEYPNNRNPLMSKIVKFQSGHFRQF